MKFFCRFLLISQFIYIVECLFQPFCLLIIKAHIALLSVQSDKHFFFYSCCEFSPQLGFLCDRVPRRLLRLNISSHQSNRDKPCASKCHHFCHAFDTHNYCPTCREAGKGDDPCVTFISPCDVCDSFTEEQLTKITHRKRYVKKPDKKADKNDQELDLLGDNSVESFAGSQADLESAADHLFTSPPCPQPLAFEALSLKTPAKTVPPTPGTALQQKLETKLEKSLGYRLDIQLDQKMGVFQANILETMKSL